jgi:macrolide transport system ATP-binding/permease protein
MEVLRVTGLTRSFGDRLLFSGVSFTLGQHDKVALVGANGSGKTTLLRLVLGHLPPDGGHVQIAGPGSRIGYLPQAPSWPDGWTLGQAIGHPVETLTAQGGTGPGPAGSIAGPRCREALKRFGLSRLGAGFGLAYLSGGERTRLGLARLWLSDANILLLDEPTAHLDLPGLRWLAGWLRSFEGAALVVSHDRYFLDETVRHVLALEDGGLRSYPGDYTAYRMARQAELDAQMALYREQEGLARRLRAAAARQAEWARRGHPSARYMVYERAKAKKVARRGQALSRQLERLESERVDKPREEAAIRLKARAEGTSGRDLLVAEDLGKAYDRPLFRAASFVIARGEKVGLVGPNGCGKTTLLQMLAATPPGADGFTGKLWRTPAARVAVLDQHAARLRDSATVLDEIAGLTRDPAQARTLLGSFKFSGDRVMAGVLTLSGGERTRLALLQMLLSPANLLLLDEPTNHLDLPARERVEAALTSYDGAIVLVSHDRYLLRRVCTKILSIERGTVVTYRGLDDYEASAAGGGAGSGPMVAPVRTTDLADAEFLVLQNRLAVLSGRLSTLGPEHPDYPAVVSEFVAAAKALREAEKGRR